MLLTPERVGQYVEAGPPCKYLEAEGGGQHFFVIVVSTQFEGKRLTQRHQLVCAALGERMRVEIHALSMKTLTSAE